MESSLKIKSLPSLIPVSKAKLEVIKKDEPYREYCPACNRQVKRTSRDECPLCKWPL